MYYVVDTEKSFEQAAADLEKAVADNQFGVLHIHDLGNTMRNKGVEFTEECKVFEVCNPQYASKVLAIDMKINMALPCRISVFTEEGQVRIGAIKPAPLLGTLSAVSNGELKKYANEVEKAIITMIDAAR